MEPQFWNDRWQSGEIGFHRAEVHDLLAKHWPSLGVAQGPDIFVPLCGKSLDMVWLAERGHRVIGVEISQIAVDAFFAERGLVPSATSVGNFAVKTAGAYEIWQGDFFDLPSRAVANVSAVYDRASLVSFPHTAQGRYAAKLAALTPAKSPIVLVSLDFNQAEMAGPPFATGLQHIAYSFAPTHNITLLETADGLEHSPNLKQRGLSALKESIYVLRHK